MPIASDLHASQTKAFIDASPTEIILARDSLVSDGAGGKKTSAPGMLSAQRVRVVGASNPSSFVSTEGRPNARNKSVIGMSDLDIQLGDTFEYRDNTYEVVDVERDPEWRVMAPVVRRG